MTLAITHGSAIQKLCYSNNPLWTVDEAARHVLDNPEIVSDVVIDSMILGALIRQRFLSGETLGHVADWLLDNGCPPDLVSQWLGRSPIPLPEMTEA